MITDKDCHRLHITLTDYTLLNIIRVTVLNIIRFPDEHFKFDQCPQVDGLYNVLEGFNRTSNRTRYIHNLHFLEIP